MANIPNNKTDMTSKMAAKLQCGTCEKQFPTLHSRKKHVQKCHSSSSNICSHCGEQVVSDSFLKKHVVKQIHEECFKCKKCCKGFPHPDKLKQHTRVHVVEEVLTCAHCQKTFSSRTKLKRHLICHTQKTRDYKCSICSQSFTQPGSVRRHMVVHTKQTPYKCDQCSRAFTNADSLAQHKVSHTGVYPYCCSICGKGYKRGKRFREHMMTHSAATGKPFKCEVCFKAFVTPDGVKQHTLTAHGTEKRKTFTCQVCFKVLTRSDILKRHMLKHTSQERVKCTKCDKTFATARNMKEHLQLHAAYKSHHCTICDQSFYKATNLQQHMANHTKAFVCGVCSKSFTGPRKLKLHLMLHSEIKPYKCGRCAKTFKKHNVLVAHVPRSHRSSGGLQAFGCNICCIGFQYATALRDHMKLHLGKDVFPCAQCTKVYSDPAVYEKHILIHTETELLKCTVCSRGFSGAFQLNQHLLLHSGKRPFKCQTCMKCFSKKLYYDKHMSRHKEEDKSKSYCHICHKGFSHPTHVKMHLKKHDFETYLCSFCPRKFDDRDHLRRHMATHGSSTCYCAICSEEFSSAFVLMEHLSTHTRLQCLFCPKIFSNSELLADHLTEHKEKETIRCGICSEYFGDKNSYQRHMKMHTTQKVLQCDLCAKEFTTDYLLRSHYEVFHKIPDKLSTDLSKTAILFRAQPDMDVKSSPVESGAPKKAPALHIKEPNAFNCSTCAQLFQSQGLLNKHMLHHSPTKLREPGGDTSVVSLTPATQASPGHAEQIYTCHICSREFRQASVLERHMSMHNLRGSHKCFFCLRTFKHADFLASHMLTHSNQRSSAPKHSTNNPILQLPHPTLDSLSRDSKPAAKAISNALLEPVLSEHFAAGTELGKIIVNPQTLDKTSVNKPLSMLENLCEFGNPGDMGKQSSPVSSNTTDPECSICFKPFKDVANLKKHMVSLHRVTESCKHGMDEKADVLTRKLMAARRDETDMVAPIPLLEYRDEVLRNHMQRAGDASKHHLPTVHSSLKPRGSDHVCAICCREFQQASSLKHHMVSHTLIKQCKCSKCDQVFTHPDFLATHMLDHLRKEPVRDRTSSPQLTTIQAPLRRREENQGGHVTTENLDVNSNKVVVKCELDVLSGSIQKRALIMLNPNTPSLLMMKYSVSKLDLDDFSDSELLFTVRSRQHVYKCSCGCLFTNFSLYNVHTCCHLPSNPLGCNFCPFVACSLQGVIGHLIDHDK